MRPLPPLPSLPVLEAVPALRAALAERGCAVLAAPPGSGKTTLVPLCLLDEPWLAGQRILMLEPRRIAARASAARMAQLRGERVGEGVGYQIRFERKVSAATRIEVITEGLLTRRLQTDAELPGVGLVIFDEFHERSLDADLALALTLDARAALRPDLRVLVMSATLDTPRVAQLLGGAPVVESGGRLHPVDIQHLGQSADEPLDAAVARGVLTALAQTRGDVLAFLPGGREIRGAQRRLHARLGADHVLRPLHGELSSSEQDLALAPDAEGRRKIILATNIAQTSLTVEGVTSVVDGGYARVARFELGSGANALLTQRISRASAEQRAGRAGRLGPGHAYRLWSRDQHAALAAHDTPDILAADLSRFALELALWGVDDPTRLALLDAPHPAHWRYARDLLRELGAVDGLGALTAHGRALARLPLPPRLGHLLLRAQSQNLAPLAAWVAALLEEKDEGAADLAQAVEQAVRAGESESRRVRASVRQLLRQIDAPETEPRVEEAEVARIVGWAYPERIALRRPLSAGDREAVYLCADGSEARLPAQEPLAQSEWLAIAHWQPGASHRIRRGVRLSREALLRDHAERVRETRVLVWDAQKQAVLAETQQQLGALVLERRALREAGEDTARVLCAGIRQMGLHVLPWDDSSRQWQARVLSLRAWRGEDWPDVSDEALSASLEDWLLPHLHGCSRREHLQALKLMEILNARFDYAAQQALVRLAPTHLEVPTGSRIRLHYQPPQPPALEVKLQEMFGCAETPAVNDGRTRVVLHLLSPAQRPIAVTQDLRGFWAGSYADVKKDMKGRYPRHPWPEDPAAATPTRRAKPRGT